MTATSLQSNFIGTIVRFVVDVTNLSNDQNIISPTVTLNNLEWSVGLRKTGDSIAFSLRSYSKNSAKYSCYAQANVQLFPKQKQNQLQVAERLGASMRTRQVGRFDLNSVQLNRNVQVHTVEKSLEKRAYTDTNSMHEINAFIDYSNFRDYYVIDNRATFEIEISTILANLVPKGFQQISSRLHITLDDVSQLNEVVSSEVIVRDVRWKVRTQRQGDSLNMYLEAAQDDFEKSSTYDVTATVKVLRFDNGQSLNKSFTHEYHLTSTKAGISPVLQWSQFIDKSNKFVFQDRAHLLVEFKVAEPTTLWNIEKLISIN